MAPAAAACGLRKGVLPTKSQVCNVCVVYVRGVRCFGGDGDFQPVSRCPFDPRGRLDRQEAFELHLAGRELYILAICQAHLLLVRATFDRCQRALSAVPCRAGPCSLSRKRILTEPQTGREQKYGMQLRKSSVCRVAKIAPAVSPEDRKDSSTVEPVHHGAANPPVPNATDLELLDEVCGPFADVPAGEAVMAVDAEATSVASVTRSIVFVASEVRYRSGMFHTARGIIVMGFYTWIPCRSRAGGHLVRVTEVFRVVQASPFAKTGGLGDVCGSLPKALAKRGHRVMVVMPRYDAYEGATFTGVSSLHLPLL